MDFSTMMPYFQKIVNSIIIKDSNMVRKYESLEDTVFFERYRRAFTKQDTLSTYNDYDSTMLLELGVTDQYLQIEYLEDLNNAPEEIKEGLLEIRRQIEVDNYVEENDYYRTYIGLCKYDMSNAVYVYHPQELQLSTLSMSIVDGVTVFSNSGVTINNDDIILISDVDTDVLNMLIDHDIINKIYETTKHEYLKFLGKNSLDLIAIRDARDLEILYITRDIPGNIYSLFMENYEKVRDFIISVFYVNEFNTTYSNFKSLMNYMMTALTFMYTGKDKFAALSQNLFLTQKDLEELFLTNHLPSLSGIKLEYQQRVAQNIEYLKRIVGSDKVLIELRDLLDLTDNVEICNLYLIKNHKVDVNGNPDFTKGADGLLSENVFEYYFQEVSMDTKNFQEELNDVGYRYDFNFVTEKDKYWVNDAGLLKFLSNEKFNYTKSKFLTLRLIDDMNEHLEKDITVQIILDNKDLMKSMPIFTELLGIGETNLYDLTLMFLSMIEPTTDISQYYVSPGFSFNSDIVSVKEQVRVSTIPYESDRTEILNYLESIRISTDVDLNKTAYNLCKLYNLLIELSSSEDIEEATFYQSIIDNLYTSTYVASDYTKTDGLIASSISDWLMDNNLKLYNLMTSISPDETVDYLKTIVSVMMTRIESLENLRYLFTSEPTNLEALRKLIQFFKPFEIELLDL